jgi:hypothetical protein
MSRKSGAATLAKAKGRTKSGSPTVAVKAAGEPGGGEAPARRIVYGGVSPVPAKPAAYGLSTVHKPAGPTITAAANPGFAWHGGPVVARPRLMSSFWGPTWSSPANKARAGRLNQYLKDLLQSKYMNILTQYGVGAGVFVRSSFVANVSNELTDTSIQQLIQLGIDNGVFPEPTANTNNVLIIFLGEGIGINEPAQHLVLCEPAHDTAFGYHSFFTTAAGHPFYYSMIPALNDTCLKQTCPSDNGCSLHLAQRQEQRQTQVTSHEFAEMVTDPQLNAWFDDTTGAENGDICNGESGTITVEGRVWTVQRMYSKFDDVQSGGASFCVTEPTNPIPRISPGPSATHVSGVEGGAVGDGALGPTQLPSVHFDPEKASASMDEQELREFVETMFGASMGEQAMRDLPAFLREAADVLSEE